MYKIIGLNHKSADISAIGGKAYNLIKISKFYPKVPHFIIIPSFFSVKAFKSLNIKDIKEIKEKINDYKIDKEIINEAQSFFKKLKIKKVILRSSFSDEDSSKKSYAGMFSSYILEDVGDSKSLGLQIKNIWKDISSERALKYSKSRENIFLDCGISVVIQQFIEPKIAGVVLGVNNDYYCEMGFDSNDKVTSGKGYDINFYFYKKKNTVWPFIYSVSINELEFKYERLINELNEFLFRACEYFDFDKGLDVEFVCDNEDLYIVQLRPLTSNIDSLYEREIPLLDFFEIPYLRSLKGFYSELDLIFYKLGLEKIRFKNRNGIYYIKINKVKKLYDLVDSKIRAKSFLSNILLHFIDRMFSVNIDEFRKKVNSLSDKEMIAKSIEIFDIIKSYEFICKLINFFCNYPEKRQIKIKVIDCLNGGDRKKFLYEIETIKKELEAMNYEELIIFYLKFKNIVDLIFGKEYMGYLFYELQNRMKLNFNIMTEYFYNLPDSYDMDVLKKHFLEMRKLTKRKNNFCKEDSVKVDKNGKPFFEGLIIVNKKFKGRVRVIKKTSKKEINPDEIMVSETTNINYIPVMIKSMAIITEFGNYTNHAAIIARELNKPCIVYVRGITSYCKDGDLIEFDGKRIFVSKNNSR